MGLQAGQQRFHLAASSVHGSGNRRRSRSDDDGPSRPIRSAASSGVSRRASPVSLPPAAKLWT